MSASIPEVEPSVIVAGDTTKWLKEVADYTPADGWTLTFHCVSSVGNAVSVNATTSGTQYLVTINSSTTNGMSEGQWGWDEYVTKAGERYRVAYGTLEVKRNLAAVTGTLDRRSHAQSMLDLIEAQLEGRAVDGIESHSIGGVPINLIPLNQLLALRDRYKAEAIREQQAEALRRGVGGSRNIFVRFTA